MLFLSAVGKPYTGICHGEKGGRGGGREKVVRRRRETEQRAGTRDGRNGEDRKTHLAADKVDEENDKCPKKTLFQLDFLLGLFDLGKDGLEGTNITEDLVHWCFACLG